MLKNASDYSGGNQTDIMLTFLKQPLLHFLLAGLLIFAAYQWTAPPDTESAQSEDVIRIDRSTLLNFMQYRAQAFQPELFNEQLEAMDEQQRQQLIDAYVREEALHREALAMGMDQGDYIIRQRLVQKVEFLLENLANQTVEPAEGEIDRFYAERASDYQVDSVYTFTHIFFDSGERGEEAALNNARQLLDSGNLVDVSFNEASQYGDRYPFLQNYVERTRDFVVNNFTEDFVGSLDELTPGNGKWHGPYASRYGYHLVLLRERSDPYLPELDSIMDRVLDDWRYEKVIESRREAEEQVISGYEVNIELE